MSNSFAERLKLLRGKVSREIFCEKIGISPRSLINYEQGLREPKGRIAAQISARLGVSLSWLLTGDGPMYRQGDSVAGASKTSDMPEILGGKKTQHANFINKEKYETSDMSEVLGLHRELLDVVRENGDLRVEVERQRARIAELERQLAEKGDGAASSQADIARLNSENRALREKVRQFERMDLHLRHYSDTLQNGLPDEE